ncbi:hypothetical protein UY3_14070 [Chelonia mydas]|uniref:Uncharacterized protein n=1 Tax=Chelonia mydas TaxID=8469 RepID=M7B0C6_CHEMY|nr:hypothetical protein UY3_14070 [Chelonia mydas]
MPKEAGSCDMVVVAGYEKGIGLSFRETLVNIAASFADPLKPHVLLSLVLDLLAGPVQNFNHKFITETLPFGTVHEGPWAVPQGVIKKLLRVWPQDVLQLLFHFAGFIRLLLLSPISPHAGFWGEQGTIPGDQVIMHPVGSMLDAGPST